MESQHQHQPFDAIPNEIIRHIISYTRPHDINSFAITCTRMSYIAQDFLCDQYCGGLPAAMTVDDFIECAARGHNLCVQAYIGHQFHCCAMPYSPGRSLECIRKGRQICIREIREATSAIDVRVNTPKRKSSLTLSELAIVEAARNKKYDTVIFIYSMFGRKYVPSPLPSHWTKSIVCRTIHDIMLEATYHIARRYIADIKKIDDCQFCGEPCADERSDDTINANGTYHTALRKDIERRARKAFQLCFADIIFVDKHGMPDSAAGRAYMRRFFAILNGSTASSCAFGANSRVSILSDIINAANCGPILAAKEYLKVMKNLTQLEIFDDLSLAAFLNEAWVIAAFGDDDLIKYREFMGAAAKFILGHERESGSDHLSTMPRAHIEYLIDVTNLDDAEIARVIKLADTTGMSYVNRLIARFSMERVKRVCDERDRRSDECLR